MAKIIQCFALAALVFTVGVAATTAEVVWGAVLAAFLFAVRPGRQLAGAAAITFGVLVLARLGAAVASRGAVAVSLGIAGIVAAAYGLSLWRRRGSGTVVALDVVVWVMAASTLIIAAAAALALRRPTFNLAFVPAAVLIFLIALRFRGAYGRWLGPALVVAVAVAGMRLGAAFGFARAADAALAGENYEAAAARAHLATRLGAGSSARWRELKAAARAGAAWPVLKALYEERDVYSSSRAWDAELAVAALARGDYERAALHGDLATTASPVARVSGKALPRRFLYCRMVAAAATPGARAWAALWLGRVDEAACGFAEAVPAEADAVWWEARALEAAGKDNAAAALYRTLWRDDKTNFAAGFGLIRTAHRRRCERDVRRALAREFEMTVAGADLKADDGYLLTRNRLSLGRTPATLTVPGPGKRRLAIVAEASGALGLYPIVTVTINGVPVHTFYMNVGGENIYETTITLPTKENELGLFFENDFADGARGLDRNVFVAEVRLGYEVDNGQ